MNVQLKDITVTARDGRVSHLDQVYIRGSHVRFFIVPDMLRFVFPIPRYNWGTRREYLLIFGKQKRSYVQKSRCEGSRCWIGKRQSYGQQGESKWKGSWWPTKGLKERRSFVGGWINVDLDDCDCYGVEGKAWVWEWKRSYQLGHNRDLYDPTIARTSFVSESLHCEDILICSQHRNLFLKKLDSVNAITWDNLNSHHQKSH